MNIMKKQILTNYQNPLNIHLVHNVDYTMFISSISFFLVEPIRNISVKRLFTQVFFQFQLPLSSVGPHRNMFNCQLKIDSSTLAHIIQ